MDRMNDRPDAHFASAVPRDATEPGVSRGIVSGLSDAGVTVVIGPQDGAREVTCELLDSALRPGDTLTVGDAVMVWTGAPNDHGVLLGRVVAPEIGMTPNGPVARAPQPETIVLDATNGLVLRVGDASIEIRADGKVLIRAHDVVSHAKRMNRIKGGAVSIN
jgi:hypothetical protein